MNIKLLTFSYTPNYGALLQTYALCKVLKLWGHNVELLKVVLYRNTLGRVFRQYTYDFFMLCFQKKYLPPFKAVSDIEKSDLYIVGSDQVWNPFFFPLHGFRFFFDFLPDGVKRISYAASFGENEVKLTKPEKNNLKQLLTKFSNVSVREDAAVEFCEKEFGISSVHVLDPTLLLDDYSEISGELSERNTLVSFKFNQSEEYKKLLSFLAKKQELTLLKLDDKYFKIGGKGYVTKHVSVAKWVKSIAESKLFVTDSFHGVAFAIIHKRQFIVLPSVASKMGRVLSLLTLLGIQDRYYPSIDDVYSRFDKTRDIDYSKVYECLDKERDISKSYLKQAISN